MFFRPVHFLFSNDYTNMLIFFEEIKLPQVSKMKKSTVGKTEKKKERRGKEESFLVIVVIMNRI